jgi:peroxiredoxin
MTKQLALLPPGLRAPPFVLPCSEHHSFALADARGSTLVVVFCPGAWEPVSACHLVLLQEFLPEIRRLGCLVVAISVESVWSQLAFARERRLQFPLLSDLRPPWRVARSYGVYSDALGASARAIFVIDGGGFIRWSHAFTVLEAIQASPQSG